MKIPMLTSFFQLLRKGEHFSVSPMPIRMSVWLLLVLFICNTALAQTMPYTFVYTTNTYTALSGPTVVSSGTSMNDATFSVTLPFSFRFNGTPYTQIYLSENGYVSFGATNPGTGTKSAISSSNTGFEVVAPFSADLQGSASTSQLSYLTSGTSPNRIFTAEWKNMKFSGGTGQTFTFQMLLKETTNVIEFKYSTVTNTGTAGSAQVGLRGADNATFLNRTTSSSWSSTTAGTVNTAACAVSSSVVPATNTLFRYTPIPTLSASGSMSAFGTCTGAPSAQQSFSVSGYYLSGNVTVSAPTNFQVSTTSGSGFTNSVTLTQTGGIVNATPIYVRMSSSFTSGSADSISITSSGATTKKVGVTGAIEKLSVSDIFVTPGGSGTITATGGTTYSWAPATGLSGTTGATVIATPSATSTYTVSGTTPGGCTDAVPVQVTVVNPGSTYTGTYVFTGRSRSFVVPSCVSQITITAKGAKGANGSTDTNIPGTAGTGALGGTVSGTAAVSAGQIYHVFVGGAATDTIGGFNGGGKGANLSGAGGGASDVRMNDVTLASRILVAGGGGGGGNTGYWTTATNGGNGGAGGGGNGTNGGSWTGTSPVETLLGGRGGAAATGGAGGDGCPLAMGSTGGNGTSGYGGNGGKISFYAGPSTTPPLYRVCGGGGGGGYIGGGGGGGGTYGTSACSQNYSTGAGGGAGGTNYVDASLTGTTSTIGTGPSGNGEVTISFTVGISTPVNASGDVVIGSGSSTTLTGTGGVTYTWSPSMGLSATTGASVVASPTITTIYTVTGTNASGCTATDNVQVSVISNAIPAFILPSPQSLSVCQNASATDIKGLLHVSDVDTSQAETWTQFSGPTHGTLTITGATATSGSADITPGGTITYQPTAGYTGSDAFTVRVSDGIATADMVVNVTVNASPNPGVIFASLDSFCHTSASAYTTTGSGGTWSSSDLAIATVTAGGFVSGVSPGTAIISYTATSASCGTASATRPVYIRPLSDTGIVTPLTGSSICTGGTITYSSTGTTAGLPRYDGVTYGGLWQTSNASIATINASGVVTGLTAGTVTISYIATGCGTFRARRTLTVNGTPSITLGTNPSVASGTTTADLTYSATASSPDQYSIVWSPAATTAGFGNVTLASLPASPIAITVPGAAAAATYTGTLTVTNSSTGCTSTNNSIAVEVTSTNTTPTFVNGHSFTIPADVCQNSNGVNLTSYLHLSDVDASQTLTVDMVRIPDRCGDVVITGGTAASGSTNITPSGSIVYSPAVAFTGVEHFTLRVSDGTASDTINVAVNVTAVTASVTSQTNVACNGGSNGAATVLVSGPVSTLTYDWTPGSPTGDGTASVSGLTAGVYTVIASDGTGCEVVKQVAITEPTALTASISSTANNCNGGSNGTATVSASGGTGALSYAWSPSGGTAATATGLSAAVYTCTVTDANNCVVQKIVTITEPSSGMTSSVSSQTNVSCNGGSNGIVTLSTSGGTGSLSYSWAPSGGTAATATGLAAGNYTVTVTDDNLCQLVKTVTVTEPSAITATVAKTDISCHGSNDGTAAVTASGGTGALVYSWFPSGGSLATATGLAGGTYTVTINDANSCELVKTTSIVDPATLSASISSHTDVTCNGGNNGSAVVAATGGTTPYSYSWSPSGGSASTAASLSMGNYTVTVTDVHSCTATASVSIAEPALVLASISGTDTICRNTGTDIHISSNPGVSVAYMINGGTTQNTTTGTDGTSTVATGNLTAAAAYTLVSVTVGGCTYPSSGTATVSVYPQATVNTITNQVVCNNASTGSVVFGGPVGGTTFTWTNNNTSIGLGASGSDSIGSFTATNTGTAAQTATITVTPTANGCEGTPRTFTIKVNPTPALSSTLSPAAICDGNTFNYTPASATSATTFQWSRAAVAGISNAAGAGTGNPAEVLHNTTADPVTVTYEYTLTANSCSNTENVAVTVNPTPALSSTKTPAAICDSTIFNYVPTSATAGTTFVWERIADESFNNATASGNDNPSETLYLSGPVGQNAYYVYTLTANGCIDTEHLAVPVEPVPSLSTPMVATPVCNNAAFSYTASSETPGVTFQWSRATVAGISNTAASGTGNISEVLNNTTTDPVEVTYVYTLSAGSCSRMQAVKVTVNPTPVLTTTLTPSAICDNAMFNYIPASATTGTAFSWSRASVGGIANTANTGNDDPNETLHNTTTDPIAVTYVYTLSANSCSNEQEVTVTVNPTPVLSSTLTATPVCNNTLFSYAPVSATTGTSFHWIRAAVTGIANTAGTGTDDPNETLNNTGTDPVTVSYVYTLTANSCANTQDVTVTVYPTPVLTSTLTPSAICDGNTFSYAPASATAGTTFQWSRAAVTGISNVAANGTGDPEEVLHNTTADPVTVIYTYTLTANGCSNTQEVSVVVNPTPILTSTLTPAAICNNTMFSYTPASATAGATFSWSRASVPGITNPATTGVGDPAEILTNTTADPVTVTYTYTLAANGCSNVQDVTVVVNPTPVFTSTLTATPVCDSSLFSYTPASATAGTTYAWDRPVVTGISNSAASGAGDPMEYLVNTLPVPVNVQYVYTLTANGCSNVQGVSVTVYPKPLLSTTLTPAAICDSTVFAYTPASLTTGTSYVWSRAAVAGISNPANADNTDPAEYLDNTTSAPVTVTYVYTLTANGCSNTQNVTVVVNPTPVLSSTLTTAPVCDSSLFSYTPASPSTGTVFTWTRDALTGISNPAASGTGDPMEYLVNTTPFPVSLQYVYTLTANGCSNVQTVQMTVNPRPLLSSTLTPAAICDSALFSYVPESLTGGTTFLWNRALTTGIANTAATGTDNPAENLYNTTADPVTVIYTYTLTAYGCSNSQDVSVVVNPTPKLSTSLTPAAICNSTVFNYPAASATAGTTFAWSRSLTTGISNAAASGVDNPMETLLNTTPAPVPVTYVYTLSANGCSFQQNVVVRINPTPMLFGATTATVCSRAPFNYSPASATVGSVFTWSRATSAGISNAAASGGGAVNETLINTTLAPKTVTYQYALTANGCSNTQNVLVTVQPTPGVPVIAITSPSSVCSQTQYQNFGAATDAPDTVQYKWTATGATVYAEGAGRRNALVSFPSAGTANVILTANATGYSCYARDTFTVVVSSSVSGAAEIYYVNDHFIYTDNTVDNYQWGYDDATTLDSVIYTGQVDQNMFMASPDFAGKKYWAMTTKSGCSNKVYYNAPVGVVTVNNAETVSMNLFPNPATENVYVEVNGGNGAGTVELVDLTGKLISRVALTDHRAVINVSNLASGVYMVTSYVNGIKVATGKLVKE